MTLALFLSCKLLICFYCYFSLNLKSKKVMSASLNIQLFTYVIYDRLIYVNEVLTNGFIIELFVSILMLVWMDYE